MTSLKGKTYEEIYGPLLAEQKRALRRKPRPSYTLSDEGRERLRQRTLGNTWAAANKGRKLSEEHKAKISAGVRAAYKNGDIVPPESRIRIGEARRNMPREEKIALSKRIKKHLSDTDCECGMHKANRKSEQTYIEKVLSLLLEEFPEIIHEKRFGPYTVDFYLPPPYHLAFEADGEYWHNKKKDIKRDRWLWNTHQLIVIRFSGRELLKLGTVFKKWFSGGKLKDLVEGK